MQQKDEFLKALTENNSQEIERLLQTELDPSFDDNYAICFAAENGFKDIVALLINDKRVDPMVSKAKPLWLAAINGHNAVVALFLFNNFDSRIYTNYKELILRENKNSYSFSQSPLIWAVENEFSNVVQLVIEKDSESYGPFQEAYILAIKKQQCAIVELLLDDDRVSPDKPEQTLQGKTPLVLAVETRNQELIQLLLNEDRIDPSQKENKAFNKACELGYSDIVKLLRDHKLKPYYKSLKFENKESSRTITWKGLYLAIKNKHTDLAMDLLEHPKAPIQQAFVWAAQEGNEALVKFLLETKHDVINPQYSKSLSLRMACEYGHTLVVKQLLQDGRALPQALGNQAIRMACEKGHFEVVELLLVDERVNPCARENKALRLAASRGFDKIVALLLQSPKMDLNNGGIEAAQEAIGYASYVTYWPVIQVFINDARLNLVGLLYKALNKNCQNILALMLKQLPCKYVDYIEQLEKPKRHKTPQATSWKASILLNTCGLFQLADSPFPKELMHLIAQNVISAPNKDDAQTDPEAQKPSYS